MATLRFVPATGNPIEITQPSVLIGRDPACDVVLSDGSVSRKHARVELRDGRWYVVDQGSANGTFLDSVRATDTALRGGQEIRFGAVSFRVEIADSEPGVTVMTEPVATMLQAPEPTAPTFPVPAAPPRPVAPPPPPSLRQGSPRPQAPSPVFAPKPMTPKKGHGPGFWIGLGCCGCLTLALLVGGGIFFGLKALTAPAVELVQQHLAHLRGGDYSAAWAQLSPSLQAELSVETLAALAAAHPTLSSNSDATLTQRSWNNGVVTLTYNLSASSGEQEQVTYRLAQQDEVWRIISIQVGSSPDS